MNYGKIKQFSVFFLIIFIACSITAHPIIGKASWYGANRQGRKMANGNRFDKNQLTAASFDLPLGSVIRVLNLENGSSVVVTVTDRGPAKRLNRILDLSESAAVVLGYKEKGITKVLYTRAIFDYESSRITSELEDDGVRQTERETIETNVQSDCSRMGQD
jgi:rare lipoprotein A